MKQDDPPLVSEQAQALADAMAKAFNGVLRLHNIVWWLTHKPPEGNPK